MAQTDLSLPVQQSSSDDVDHLIADWKWAYDCLAAGEFDRFCGEYVAVLQRSIVGHGTDQEELRSHVSQQQSVDGERVVVLYVDAGEFLNGG